MPFGRKLDAQGSIIDFDAVYRHLIVPSVTEAGLDPIRTDEQMTGGVIQKAIFEGLILCEYTIADLTTANANVFYELGLRHAVRPACTVLIFGESGGQLPFDVASLHAIPYKLSPDGKPANPAADSAAIANRLKATKAMPTDSPVFQLVEGFPDIQRLKTDVFRDRVRYSIQMKDKLATARKQGADAVRAVEQVLGSIAEAEAGIVIDLFLSYRAVKAWQCMIDLVPKMSQPLAATVMVREQLGLALNRVGRGDEAERVLLDLIASRGRSSETAS
jgi:hypothetical protein